MFEEFEIAIFCGTAPRWVRQNQQGGPSVTPCMYVGSFAPSAASASEAAAAAAAFEVEEWREEKR